MNRLLLIFFVLTFLIAPLARAETPANPSGLPLPRYANLKWNEVNGRLGPDHDAPVRYKFSRRHLPVRILEESPNDLWRRVEDPMGGVSWVNKSQLITSDHVLIREAVDLRRAPKTDAPIRARLTPDLLARLERCDGTWCAIRVDGYRGWVPRQALWGAE